MSARVSAQMLEAIALIKGGATRTTAAKMTGLRVTSISRSRLYKEWAAQQAKLAGLVKQKKP